MKSGESPAKILHKPECTQTSGTETVEKEFDSRFAMRVTVCKECGRSGHIEEWITRKKDEGL
jgi:hypothetical protein